MSSPSHTRRRLKSSSINKSTKSSVRCQPTNRTGSTKTPVSACVHAACIHELITYQNLYFYYFHQRFKLQTSQFKLDVANNHLCNLIVCNWSKLPDSIVATDTIDHFKKALCTVYFEVALTFNRHS